jgi:hypothetical protein
MSKILEALTSDTNKLESPANSPNKVSKLKQELEQAKKGFDPNYEYSDDHSYWREQKDKANKISSIKKQLRDAGENITESQKKTISVLTEARTYKLWESAGRKIMEAELSQDQIQNLFKSIETAQSAAGGNRTLLGKGKDAASAVNKAWEDLKTKVQNSGPIKNVDAMYDKAADQLKQATGGDQGVMKYVQKYRDFAKKHPVAQSLIYSALIAAAGISGAGLGGAAALGLFKMVDKLLQGEKFSSAAYSGGKTGAMAYGASKVGDMFRGGSEAGAAPGSTGATDTAQNTLAATRQAAEKEAMEAIKSRIANGEIKPTDTGAIRELAQTVLDGSGMPPQAIETSVEKLVTQSMGDVASKAGGQATLGMDTAGDVAQSVGSKPPISVNLPGGEMKFADQAAYDAWQNGQQLTQVQMPGGAVYSLPQTQIDQATDAAQSVAQSSAPIDYTKPGPTSVDSLGQKLEYGIPINDKGSFVAPNPNLPPEELAQQTAAYNAWKQNYMSRFPEATLRPDGTMQAFKPGLAPMFPGGNRVQETVDKWKRGERLAQTQPKKLSESQIYLIIGKVVEKEKLKEGIMDTVKGAAGKARDWAATKGKNLTTKVTADKLLQAWKKAGSPTDSDKVAQVLQGAGVSPDIIKQTFGGMKLPTPNAASDAGTTGTAMPTATGTSTAGTTGTAMPTATGTSTAGTTGTAMPAASANKSAGAAGDQKEPTIYKQTKNLLGQLDKKSKLRIIATLKKDLQLAESGRTLSIFEITQELLIENKNNKEYNYDDPDWDAKISRLGKMAKEGPRKTGYDPVKRVYKTVPVNPPKEKGVAEGSEYTPPKLGTVKASIMNTTTPTVQIQVFKHNTLRGDSYWVTKQVKTFKTMDQAKAYVDRINKQGVAEGSNDTIYPNAEVIKSKNGKPVGEIYQDGNSWGAFHYRADRGYDLIDSREDAIEALKDLHQETGRSRPDYTIKGVAEVSDATKQSYKSKAQAQVRELEPHAKKGEYKDIAQRAIDRRQKGLAKLNRE